MLKVGRVPKPYHPAYLAMFHVPSTYTILMFTLVIVSRRVNRISNVFSSNTSDSEYASLIHDMQRELNNPNINNKNKMVSIM